jgi:RNA polymerase sigma-70 factor (ECF subfamily)
MLCLNRTYIHLSDEELFALVKRKDCKAFSEIYRRCKPALLEKAFRKLQSKESAEDIVQDLFLNVYLRSASLEFSVSLKAYLHAALKYKINNAVRSKITREKYARNFYLTADVKINNSSFIELKECRERIERTLRSLPPQCRKVFELSRNEEQSYKEISGKLGISISAVEKHVSRALRTLRKTVLAEG